MHAMYTWEQSPTFDPYNPNQIVREQYVGIPGGYGSFYFNKKPTLTTALGGAGLQAIPPLFQTVLVGGLAAVAGYFAYKYGAPKLGLAGLGVVSYPPRGIKAIMADLRAAEKELRDPRRRSDVPDAEVIQEIRAYRDELKRAQYARMLKRERRNR